MATLELKRTLQARGPAAALVLTDEEVAVLGGGKRAAVLVRVGDRQATLRLAVMGGENLIGMSKASRAELGVAIGDELAVAIMLDEAPRKVTVPDDLDAALTSDPAAKAARRPSLHGPQGVRRLGRRSEAPGDPHQPSPDETLVMLREGRRKS